ncbi:Selenocysteine lyase/Cysteine desulfurase [Microbacterium sp. LKL04]|uniref:aminotransferase class V-fold PLP-dependent enzyme n=1 Tax=Microbacterium sp. LKL04 TaxID=912630 RepID=UPI000875D5D4|nr:aminotransferase class V-fold PLP-dependent enzyme [Microbacterium sp. LKL04]SCY09589.1 Selenocysteine lyase/Cysteine desulfurase [Microbacterium sp. LKL04]
MALSPADVRAAFPDARGYVAACTAGIPTRATRAAVRADLDALPDPVRYAAVAERCRTSFARLVGVAPESVALGAQTSAMVSLLAASLPDGAVVLCPDGEFSSLVLPFVHAGRGITVRTVPLEALAASIEPGDTMVAFSIVQSATGAVADADAIVAAARAHGVRTLCDATQAVGWMPVAAGAFDALVCHAYKWLCAPRGVAFLTVTEDFAASILPRQAGWYAGTDPWASCYGGDATLAASARRFDVSPAWQAFVGAEPALALFADANPAALRDEVTALAAALRSRLGLPQPIRATPIVTWRDENGADIARLREAGVVASSRAGNARVALHVFNDLRDVDDIARTLGR